MTNIFSIEVTGDETAPLIYGRAAVMADPVLVQTMREGFEGAFRVSQLQVPFRYGGLKGSGRITGPTRSGANWEMKISYGNTAVVYAYYQHEGQRRDGTHRIRNYHNGKKGQYVFDPVNAMAVLLTPILVARVEALFGKGTVS